MMEIVRMLMPWWVCVFLLVAVLILGWARMKWRAWRDEVRAWKVVHDDWITVNCPGCAAGGAPAMPVDPGWPA